MAISLEDVKNLVDVAGDIMSLRIVCESGKALADVVLGGAGDSDGAKAIAERLREQWAVYRAEVEKR